MHKLFAFLLIFTFTFSDLDTIFDWPLLFQAEAAQVTIDATVSTNSPSHTQAQATVVFISDQVGYKFYRDSTDVCVYSKTTNGGVGWGAAVTVDSQIDCERVEVWYDQWTPGDLGTNIHIVTMDSGNDDLWYNRLDTTSDTLLLGSTPVSVVLAQTGLTITAALANHSVTKGTNGIIYVSIADSSDRFVVSCSATCQTAGNWTEVGDGTQMDADEDLTLMVPLDSGKILLINRDITADDIRSKEWSGSSWSGSWLTVDANAILNTTYDIQMSAVRSPVTGDVYLAYIADADNNTADHDIRLAKYSGGSWTNLSDYVTNSTRGLTSISLSIDENNNTVYLAYSGRSTPATASTGNVYWATSTTAMSSWGAERGPVNTTSGDIYGVNLNYFSNERIYATWYEAALDDMFGDTLADVTPITVVSASGSQTNEVRADTSNFYVGGKFVIKENVASRNVTDIIISENGTVNAATGLNNIKLRYDLDTSDPYDCASESYGGSETQFGSTDANGFSGADGTSAFTGSVTITPTQAMCVYVVLDVLKAAGDGTNIDIEISNPATDVLVSGGVTAVPINAQKITGLTNILDSNLTLTHYHWRDNAGNESGSASLTSGSQDVPFNELAQELPVRLRMGISNEGSTSSLPTTLRLEFADNPGTCSAATGWTDVGATDDEFNMFDSTFITDGTDSTDISNAIGGVDNENTVFLSPNGGLRDTSSSLGALTFLPTNWTEAEFSIVASTTSIEGSSYCFRLTDAGTPLPSYSNYPSATIIADVTVGATSSQAATVDIPTTDFYIGGAFTIIENSSNRNVTSITITENGTVDAQNDLENIRLFYDLDETAPFNCTGESYGGGETQFGTASSFNSANGSSTFSGSVNITTSRAMCVYVVLDVKDTPINGQILNVTIDSGSGDVSVDNAGSVAPSTVLDIVSSTTLQGAIVTQAHYHWRNDDGNETGATSATGGSEDTDIIDFSINSPIRLRIGLSNEGFATSTPHRYGLEYGIKSSTCDAITVWNDVDGGGVSWSMFDSSFLTNGETTTNIAVANGGVSDPIGKTFLNSNGGVRDSESFSATTTLKSTEFVDLEYSITTTLETPYETPFCFRVTQNGVPLLQYNQYAEVKIEPKRDFKIQRGISTVSGNGLTLTAGVNYDAPSASNRAFVRITNSHYTGAGGDVGGGNQTTDDYAAYISNPGNVVTNFTISRPVGAAGNTHVAWEIVEYIGPNGGDNEIFVRSQNTLNYGAADLIATGTAVASILDDNDVVVFITGQSHDGANRTEAFAHQSTASWFASTDQPVLQRGSTGANAGSVSYAVVEFVGLNWKVQRVEHLYTKVGEAETKSISAVNSLARTFLHSQKRYDGTSSSMADFGQEVWLSSIGAVSFQLSANAATTTTNHTGVAWVVENIQTSTGEMLVQRSNGNTTGGTEPLTLGINIPTLLNATNNASIFTSTTLDSTGNNYPQMIAGAAVVSTNSYQIWRSDTGNVLSYRTEIVQWPAADLAVRQNYYRFYVDNNSITPTDAWPAGAPNLGENTSIGILDEPLSDGDRIRIRMTLKIRNATLPGGLIATKLQYGVQTGTCSAVSVWNDVGAPGSGSIWRGYNATGITDGISVSGNPPTGGDLLISVADRAGRYTESNPSAANQFAVYDDEDVEYDWIVEQNGAAQRTVYCFRMIKIDETALDGYLYYPEIRTEGFTPVTNGWRWYDDEINETPTVPLANESVTPTNVLKGNSVKLRVTVDEIKNLPQVNAGFKLQFAEKADFSDVQDVVATTTCVDTSVWCYYDAAEADKSVITTAVLSGSDSCIAGVGTGCGTHVESSLYQNGFTHTGDSNREYEFSLTYTNIERNYGRVYYFRLYDLANNEAVLASSTDPSLAGESAKLVFSIGGVDANTTIAGVITDATTTATTINFGSLPLDTDIEVAQQLTVDTNAIEGYQIFKYADQQLLDSYSNQIVPITGSNAVPVGWTTGCGVSAVSCFGYHTTDATLAGASGRFAPIDSYASLSTALSEIMYSSVASIDVENVIYRMRVSPLQPAGDYTTSITYIAVPVY